MIVGGIVLVGLLGYLAFGYFGVHTLFIDDKVDEDNPFETAADAGTDADAGADAAGDTDTDTDADTDTDDEGGAAAASDPDADDDGDETQASDAPTVETLATGTFGARSHPAEGDAIVLSDGTETYLRFENFATDNGPDLYVYLSTAPADAPADDFDDDFVDLGRLKGNIGDQNYLIPDGTDLSTYSTVVIWCEDFTVAFGSAALS